MLLTEWGEIIEAMRRPKFQFDGRNALDATFMTQLGFQYAGVGRRYSDLRTSLCQWARKLGSADRISGYSIAWAVKNP